MENNNQSQDSLAGTTTTAVAVNSSNGEPVAAEIIIYDECGDTMWDKVLAQKSFLDLKSNEQIGKGGWNAYL